MPDFPDRPEGAFERDIARAAEWISAYRRRLPDLPVLPQLAPGAILDRIPTSPPCHGEPIDSILRDLDDVLLDGLTHWNHPGFFAYFCSSTTDAGILADLVAAELNQNAMLWRTSPGGTELEERMVEWIRNFVGLPDAFRGLILDTASSSSFTALLAARERAVPGVRQKGLAGRTKLGPCTLYVSEDAHSSLDKSAMAAGLGLEQVRHVAVDGDRRMVAAELEHLIVADREAGCAPVMVCATIGTTSTTSVDPVGEIADVCERQDVWLHVDAAYAGPAAALPEKRWAFDGWERADSIVINAHKWMFTPIDCSVLMYRDDTAMRRSLSLTPEYLRSSEDGSNLMDIGLSLGRRFRALKLWFLFRHAGAEGLRAMLREHLRLTEEFVGWLERDRRFAIVMPVPFSLVCFRAHPQHDVEPNEWNRRLVAAVNAHGPVFLSHTVLDGVYTIRMAIGSARVTRDAVRNAYELLVGEYDRMTQRTREER